VIRLCILAGVNAWPSVSINSSDQSFATFLSLLFQGFLLQAYFCLHLATLLSQELSRGVTSNSARMIKVHPKAWLRWNGVLTAKLVSLRTSAYAAYAVETPSGSIPLFSPAPSEMFVRWKFRQHAPIARDSFELVFQMGDHVLVEVGSFKRVPGLSPVACPHSKAQFPSSFSATSTSMTVLPICWSGFNNLNVCMTVLPSAAGPKSELADCLKEQRSNPSSSLIRNVLKCSFWLSCLDQVTFFRTQVNMRRPQTFLQNVGACAMHVVGGVALHRKHFLMPKLWINVLCKAQTLWP